MPFRSGLMLLLVPILGGCSGDGVSSITIAPQPSREPALGAETCRPNEPCELTGAALIQHRTGNNSWAVLSQRDACIPLLLSRAVYQASRHWNGKRIRVTGIALARGPASNEILLLQYRDRWLSPSICAESTLALYVETIMKVGK